MQSRKQSAIETAVNILVGIALSFGSNIIILKHFGVALSVHTNVGITLWFTGVSIIRSYTLRRVFNKYHEQREVR